MPSPAYTVAPPAPPGDTPPASSPDPPPVGHDLEQHVVLRLAHMTITCCPVVVALTAPDLPAAARVAHCISAELDLIGACRITAPDHPEIPVGAVTADGPVFLDTTTVDGLHLTEAELTDQIAVARRHAHHDQDGYHRHHDAPPITGHVVVLLEAHPTTGLAACAALEYLRATEPSRLVMAAPACPSPARTRIAQLADDIVTIHAEPAAR